MDRRAFLAGTAALLAAPCAAEAQPAGKGWRIAYLTTTLPGDSLGYQDTSTFIAIFRKQCGASPARYMKWEKENRPKTVRAQ